MWKYTQNEPKKINDHKLFAVKMKIIANKSNKKRDIEQLTFYKLFDQINWALWV